MTETISSLAKKIATNFEKNERVVAGRLLIQFIKLIDKEKYLAGRNFYAYIRYLDDVVDEGKNPKKTKVFLRNEIRFLESLKSNDFKISGDTDPYHELVVQGLANTDRKKEVIQNLINGIKGFYLDTIAILYNKPLPEIYQVKRNSLNLLSYLEVLSYVLFKRSFSGDRDSEEFDKIISAWAELDALRDYHEDFAAGLVLFSRRDLKKHKLNLEAGEKVPKEFDSLHKELKIQNIITILKNLGSLNKSTLPLIFRLTFQLYFLRGISKLAERKPMGETKIIFAQNKLEA